MTVSLPSDPFGAGGLELPIEIHSDAVRPEWIDYNGHMNVAYYVLAFDLATDQMLNGLDLGIDYAGRTQHSTFVLETHVSYLQEVGLGDPLRFALQLLDADQKRLHYFISMYHGSEGYLAATSEQIALHVDLASRRAAPIPAWSAARIETLLEAHRELPRPEQAGRVIAIRRRTEA